MGKIELVRLIRDGKLDDTASLVIVTDLLGQRAIMPSGDFRAVETAAFDDDKDRLESMLTKAYPVWMQGEAVQVRHGGQIIDKDLFKAVLQGK